MTIDTSGLMDGIQTLMESVFEWVPVALLILAPIAAIGIGFGFGNKIIGMVKSAFGGGGR